MIRILIMILIGCGISSCGYHFQTSKNEPLEDQKIYKIYIAPVTNSTYKPGVESVVYNALTKRVAAHRKITIVSKPREADVVLAGSVDFANLDVAASTNPNKLNALGEKPSTGSEYNKMYVATLYNASVGCSFSLIRAPGSKGEGQILFSSSYSRSKSVPGNNQIGVLGTTSHLINDSEFDRALKDLVDSMMGDVHEALLARF